MSDLDFMSTSMMPHKITRRDNIKAQAWIMQFGFTGHFAPTVVVVRKECRPASARGFVRGHFFNREGQLVNRARSLIRPQGDLREASATGAP